MLFCLKLDHYVQIATGIAKIQLLEERIHELTATITAMEHEREKYMDFLAGNGYKTAKKNVKEEEVTFRSPTHNARNARDFQRLAEAEINNLEREALS